MLPSRKQGRLYFLRKSSSVRRKTMIRFIKKKKSQKFQDKGKEGRWIFGGNKKGGVLRVRKRAKHRRMKEAGKITIRISEKATRNHAYY